MDTEMTTMHIQRTVDTITAEINTLHQQASTMMLNFIVQIGQRLEEVKKLVPHGEWGNYLKERTPYSQSSANNFMRLAREFGDSNLSLFGKPKSEVFGNLTYTKALAMLALPDAEREEMAEEAVSMSTRELEKAIRERNEARKEAERLRKNAEELDAVKSQLDAAMDAQKTAQEAEEEARSALEAMEKELAEAREVRVVEPDKEALAEAERAGERKGEAKLKEAYDVLEKAKQGLAKAEENKAKLEKRVKELEQAAKGERKELSMGAEAFAALFNQAQKLVNDMLSILREMEDRETAGRLRKAVDKLADHMKQA